MQNELVVIPGAEACVLLCTMAMILRARRMDVLSGRFLGTTHGFRQPVTGILYTGSVATELNAADEGLPGWRQDGSVRTLALLDPSGSYGLASKPSGEVRPGWWLGPGCSYASITDTAGRQSRFLGAGRKASVRGYVVPAPGGRVLDALSFRLARFNAL
jgi:hypothetical protein